MVRPHRSVGHASQEKGSIMAVFIDPVEAVRKTFLAGVGAVATGAEKSQQVIDDLVKKGQLTVEQGKSLNEELTRKVKDTINDRDDQVLRSKLQNMTEEERAAYAKKVADMAADIDSKATKVDVEVEDADDEAEGE